MIDQFMWTWQRIYRKLVETQIKSALEEIGFFGDLSVMLVGFDVTKENRHPVCIEPEDGIYHPSQFSDIPDEVERAIQTHPERDRTYSDPIRRAEQPHKLRRKIRKQILTQKLEALPFNQGRYFISSDSPQVGDFEIYTIASFDKTSIARAPQLRITARDFIEIPPSLIHAVVDQVLDQAAERLKIPAPMHMLDALNIRTADVVRNAVDRLISTALYCTEYFDAPEAFATINLISSLPYEGRSGVGRLVFSKESHPDIQLALELVHPVKLSNTRAIRKLLEATGPGADLLVMDGKVCGLGNIQSSYDGSSETVFAAEFITRGYWEFTHNDQALIAVRDGIARLPEKSLNLDYLRELIERLLPGADQDRLISLARAAEKHSHGAMLVISSEAAAESARLSPQSWLVRPSLLDDMLLKQLTDMDGATLVDPQGYCHAIGVILDGVAAGEGNPARGSRYNNVIRYLRGNPPPAIVVVYSSDGSIDILPRLRLMSRISKSSVNAAISQFMAASTVKEPSLQELISIWNEVLKLRFYLNEEQCTEANAAVEIMQKISWNETHSRWHEPKLAADPEMNESYWLPE